MAGFLLTGGTEGCPITEAVPTMWYASLGADDYESPFRLDAGGRIWITSCFGGFREFGAAVSAVSTGSAIGTAPLNVSTNYTTNAVTDTGASLVVTNDTECDIVLMFAMSMYLDMETRADNLVAVQPTGYVDGVSVNTLRVTNPKIAGSTALVRQIHNPSFSMWNPGVEAGTYDTPTYVLAPGDTKTMTADTFIKYEVGSATGTEHIYGLQTAFRVYGYSNPS